jgi:vitamin B12 transporter
MVLFFFVLISLFSSMLVPPVAAQQEEALPPVVVTATRTETPQQDVTTSISVITAKDIEAQHAVTVSEILRNVPGLDVVQSGSRGNPTSVFIRGSESDQLLVLIDGVEANSTTLGAFDFAHLMTDNIERIEVLRGAGGTLYGSQAIGGVINIITKKGVGPPQLTVSPEGGNWSTHREAFAMRGGAGKLGYSLSAARLGTEGFHRRFDRSNDDYRNLSTSGRLDYSLTDDTSLKGIFRFVKTDLGLFNSNNFVPGNPGDPNAREGAEQYLGKLEWEQRILHGWDYRISGSIFKEHIKDKDDPEPGSFDGRERSRFRPQIATAEFQSNYRWEEWSTTTFGVEFKRRKASTASTFDGFDVGGIDRAIRNMGYYLQEQIRFFDGRLILVPGVRLDDHQTFGTEWSPSFSSAYLFKETGTKLKAGYAEGFKAPTLNELFFPTSDPRCASFGNPNLGPERSWELNAGFEQNFIADRVAIEGTYFHREVKDLISFAPVAQGACPFVPVQATNLGTARFDGVEWGLKVKIFAGLTGGANYTYLDWDTATGKLARRPRHRGNVNLNYLYDAFQVNLGANFIGRRDDNDSATAASITKPGYVKFDLAGSYQLPVKIDLVKSVSLFGKIENLFNKKYEEADGFRARPLNFLIGLRGTFGKTL